MYVFIFQRFFRRKFRVFQEWRLGVFKGERRDRDGNFLMVQMVIQFIVLLFQLEFQVERMDVRQDSDIFVWVFRSFWRRGGLFCIFILTFLCQGVLGNGVVFLYLEYREILKKNIQLRDGVWVLKYYIRWIFSF